MRSNFLAIVAALMIGVVTPALASAKHHQAPSFDACFALSVERGAGPGQGNSSNPEAQHNAFMRQCLDGKTRV